MSQNSLVAEVVRLLTSITELSRVLLRAIISTSTRVLNATEHRFVIRVRQSKGIRHAIEEREQRDDVNRLGDLRVGPAALPQARDVVVGDRGWMLGEDLSEVEQRTLGGGQRDAAQVAALQRGNDVVGSSLRPQEKGVRADSIPAMIQTADVGGEHLFDAPRKMAVGEVQAVGKLHHLPQEVGP